jgi:hypothetical protein
MNAKLFSILLLIGILALIGCGLVTVIPESSPPPRYQKARQPFLVPKGHLPPPGECRIWYPNLPPGKQPPPGNCAELASRVPLGAWLITRPENDRDKLKVFVYDMNRPKVVVVIRWYHAFTGKFISEKKK